MTNLINESGQTFKNYLKEMKIVLVQSFNQLISNQINQISLNDLINAVLDRAIAKIESISNNTAQAIQNMVCFNLTKI